MREVGLDTARQSIDFDVERRQARLTCLAWGATAQKVHDRKARSWRHLDFFQYEVWLHAEAPATPIRPDGRDT